MNEDKPSSKIPIFSSKKSEALSGRKNFKNLLLILGPLVLGGILISWGLGRLVGHHSEPEEVFPVVFQGPGQARRAAIGEWAYQLRSVDFSDPSTAQNPWLPRGATVARLLRLLNESPGENDSLYKSSLVIVLGYAPDSSHEVSESIEKALAASIGLDPQFSIQALLSLARLHEGKALDSTLLTRLQSDPDPALRKALAFALGSGLWVQDAAVRPALYALLRDSVDDVRWNAAFALAAQGDREGLSVINELVDRAAKMDSANAEPLTEELLGAFNEAFRWADKLNDPKLIEKIREMGQHHRNLKIRQAALAQLSKT